MGTHCTAFPLIHHSPLPPRHSWPLFWVRLAWLVTFAHVPRQKLGLLEVFTRCFRRCWKLGMLLYIHFKPETLIFLKVWLVGQGREHLADCMDVLSLHGCHFWIRKSQWSPLASREHWFFRSSLVCFEHLPVLVFAFAVLFVWRAFSPIFAILSFHCSSKLNTAAASSILTPSGLSWSPVPSHLYLVWTIYCFIY